jgi:hypothetical protein
MSLTNGATLLASSAFIGQVGCALLKLSNDISNEAANTALHAKRIFVANNVLYKYSKADAITILVARLIIATNATVRAATSPTDSDVEFVASSLLGSETALDSMIAI